MERPGFFLVFIFCGRGLNSPRIWEKQIDWSVHLHLVGIVTIFCAVRTEVGLLRSLEHVAELHLRHLHVQGTAKALRPVQPPPPLRDFGPAFGWKLEGNKRRSIKLGTRTLPECHVAHFFVAKEWQEEERFKFAAIYQARSTDMGPSCLKMGETTTRVR